MPKKSLKAKPKRKRQTDIFDEKLDFEQTMFSVPESTHRSIFNDVPLQNSKLESLRTYKQSTI